MILNKQAGFTSLILIILAVVTGAALFYLGTQYNKIKMLQGPSEVEAAPGGRKTVSPILADYANCEGYKHNTTDTTPPTISIIKPVDGETITGIRGGGNSIVLVTVKATDNTWPFPLLYIDDIFTVPWFSFYTSQEDPTLQIAEIYVSLNKTYTLKAKVCDSGGNEAWSPVVKFSTSR